MNQDDQRQRRAQERLANYPGMVVQAGQEKPALYSELTLLERLAHQTELVARLTTMNGLDLPKVPRTQWPGEIFRIGESRSYPR